MQYKKLFVFVISILMIFFSQFSLAHDIGILHQHGEELAILGVLAAALIGGLFWLKFRRFDR